MKILFTGASSFTGSWFVEALRAAGHDVVATFTRASLGAYDDGTTRGARVRRLVEGGACEPLWGARFGDDAFIEVARRGRFARLCHHAAQVTDYKSPSFDAVAAVGENTRRVVEVLEAAGCPVVLTGSYFEPGEGAGGEGLRAMSPYGLSKGLTAQVFGFHAQRLGVTLGKFVISNPFGPYEEARFTRYLARTWFAGEEAGCRTPRYVRDNIHVGLLARAYADFTARLSAGGPARLAPSGYVETQGAFAERFAAEMRPRLSLPCALRLSWAHALEEPAVRINIDSVDAAALGFDEARAWDALAAYYEACFRGAGGAQKP